MRVLIELLHILAGLMAALVIGYFSAWSYPPATRDIWLVTFVAMIATMLMGVGSVRRALAEDRRQRGEGTH